MASPGPTRARTASRRPVRRRSTRPQPAPSPSDLSADQAGGHTLNHGRMSVNQAGRPGSGGWRFRPTADSLRRVRLPMMLRQTSEGAPVGRIRSGALAAIAVTFVVAALAVPSSAAPLGSTGHAGKAHGRALADLAGDHLSDGLGAKLAGARPGARIGVVATFTDRVAMRAARGQLGGVQTTFSLIAGFAARLTTGQIRSLAHRPGVVRVEQNFAIHVLDDVANRDFGVTGAQTDFAASGAGTEVCVVGR